jgi:vitamin B12 transporter
MKRHILCLSACALAFAAAPAFADASSDPTPVAEVVVTSTRLPTPLQHAPDAHVIDEQEIQARGAVFAEDVLETIPGVSVSQTGAFGGVTSVRMRGASSDKTLVLIDGVPANDPSSPAGSFDFGGFDLADIKRVEVLSGPQGALWGSDAIGGVIAFTTREPNGLQAQVEAGSYNTARGALSVGRSEDSYAVGLNASVFSTGGISSADVANGNTERDGLYSQTVSLNGRIDPTDWLKLDAKVRWSDSKSGIDGFVPPNFVLGDTNDVYRRETWSGLARATIQGPWGFEHTLSFSDYRETTSTFGESGDFPFNADRQVWRWQAERGKPDDLFGLDFGAEREDTRASLSDGSHESTGVTSAFALGRFTPWKPLTLTGSLRWDDPDSASPVTTGRAAAVLDIGHGFSLNGSWGQGFKVPSISELACDFCFPAGPATNLRPERAEGWDAGVKWRSPEGRYEASVTAYRLAVRDQIDFVFDPVSFDFRYQNIDRTRARGVEAEGLAVLAPGLVARANWSWTDAVDQSTGDQLLRVPKNQGSLTLEWTHGRGRAALTVRDESTQADAGGTRPGFVTAALNTGWRLSDKLEATLRLVNLADTHYEEALGYGEPRRSAYVGLRLRY